MSRLVLFNKPYQVLCQFTDNRHQGDKRSTLADYIQLTDIYPAGRLDFDSEGLLLLTDDGKLQHRISHPANKMPKSYWVQVEGEISRQALSLLRQGINLKDGPCAPARARKIAPPDIWQRVPPIRQRKHIPTSWLELTIREGRNRQVRRMTAATGFPTLRLIRHRIGTWSLGNLQPGEYKVMHV